MTAEPENDAATNAQTIFAAMDERFRLAAGTTRSDVERREAEAAMLSDVRRVAHALRLAAERHGVPDDPVKRFIVAAADAAFADTNTAAAIGRRMQALSAK